MEDFLNSQLWHDLVVLFYKYIANWSAAIQLTGLGLLILFFKWFARFSVIRINAYLKSKSITQLKSLFDLSIREILFLLYLTVSLWTVMIVTDAMHIRTTIIDTAVLLLTTWVVVRFISGLIEHSLWTRVVAIIVWLIAAVKILGISEATNKLLDSYSLQMGSVKVTMLTVIHGIVAFSILFWGVHVFSELIEKRFKQSRQLTRAQKVLFVKIIKILLLALAVILGLNYIGIDLTTVAIFSSALGFGVAFGLQKVFSNFVSGIILLMDKSIQPGDVIAVGNTYGEVVNLEARYVSVVTRDGKAHLIPNEVLITEKVENWSYNDNLLRLRVPVGVSYDSDLREVEKLLLEAAKEHPRVLEEPGPKVMITEFGDSSINFELRVWIADPMNGVGMPQSELLFIIWEKFQKHKIEIPFNRLDVHLKDDAKKGAKLTRRK